MTFDKSTASLRHLFVGDRFVEINSIASHFVLNLKLEGLSLTGSIKVKSALSMIEGLESRGLLRPGMQIIESSSGNLGLALSMICATKGYPFTCVSDANISPTTARMIEAHGARLIIVNSRDSNGGYLGARIALIGSMLDQNPDLLWTNQYASDLNVDAHYSWTGPEILRRFASPDAVFIGAGTTGTLGGVARCLRERSPRTRVIAVDSVGSVTFGGPAGERHIPGLGTSQRPAIADHASFDEMLMIPERATIAMCRRMARTGLLVGGSTGTVLCGVEQYAASILPGACIVAISADMGDRYIDTIYSDEWVRARFPGLLHESKPPRSNTDSERDVQEFQ